jgi:catechol 2,3-dioxygenase-like lactoylglutathione lyase family enzyme
MKARLFVALAAFTVAPLPAQLAAPNADGISMGHIHLAVKDVEAHKQFWTTMMGGTLVKNGPLEMIQFPGVYILLRQAEPTGPPAGSIVNHFGFVVKDMPAMLAKWRTNKLPVEQGDVNPNQGYVTGPDGIRVEIFGDPSLSTPILMNHIHFYPADIPAMQAWYAKTFGGVSGKRARVARPGWIDSVDLPGVNLSFSQGEKNLAATKGRSLDHIGFEVKNLEEFVKKLQAEGIKLDVAPRSVPNSKVKIAFLTDPWGTYIELTEGLAPAPAQSASR